jgi:hypothetical protein
MMADEQNAVTARPTTPNALFCSHGADVRATNPTTQRTMKSTTNKI